MSLLLDALRRAEEARRAKEADSNAVRSSPAVAGKLTRPQSTNAPPSHELALDDVTPVVSGASVPIESTTQPAGSGERSTLSLEEMPSPVMHRATSTDSVSNKAATLNALEVEVPKQVAQRDLARNVFAAKQPGVALATAGTKRKWILPVAGVAFVLLGAGAWYVWSEVSKMSQPVVARAPVMPTSLPAAAPKTGQIASQSAPAADAVIVKIDEPLLPPLLPPQATEAPLSKLQVPSTLATEKPLTAREALAKRLIEAPVPKEEPTGLKLARSTEPPKLNPELALAYQSLASGDYGASQQRYARLVLAEPMNVDAHLGLATAAARLGDSALAVRHYRQVLALDPRNGLAIVGLISLNEGAPAPALEIELKTLIGRNPDAAPLHFALGNTYARERRWTEAQQAYFDAFRIDPANPDYAFNLAVSLDQLRQPKLALDYYRKAEGLAAARGGGQFDRNAIAKRIRELGGESIRNQ